MTHKILIFSDLHASIRHGLYGISFVDEVQKTLEWVAEVVRDRQIKTVFFLGDVFHVQEAVDTPSLHTVVQGFKKILEHARVFVIEGNHDVYRKDGQWTSVEALRDLYVNQNLLVPITRATTYNIDGLYVQSIPYTEKGYTPDPAAHVMFGHLEVTGAYFMVRGLKEEHGVDATFSEFQPKEPGPNPIYYVGGHYHHPQVLGTTLIAGACCFHSYQDQIVETPRGAVILTLDRPRTPGLQDFQWVENPHARPTHTIKATSYADAQAQLDALKSRCSIPQSRWRVRTYLPVPEAAVAVQAQESETAPIPMMVIPDAPSTVISRTKITSKTVPTDALDEYMKQVPPAKLEEQIKARGKTILEAAMKGISGGEA